MNHMFPGLLLNGSVTMGLGGMLLNGTALDIYTSNGYVVVKAINSTDKILVIDPETGVVRDMNTANGFCGSYCYYGLQTELALNLGNALINSEPEWLSRINRSKRGGND